jgi:CO dehydrogenase/acetyl-CoA synthase gamma subunit (corrinoid Fe-S protein)
MNMKNKLESRNYEVLEIASTGKKAIKAINKSGLLFCVKGADADQMKALLKASSEPLIFMINDIPEKEVLDLIKEKESAIGLVLSNDVVPSAHFKKIDAIKESIGTQHVMIVNESCLWKDEGKNAMLNVISEIIEGKYERSDFANILSRTFLRVLNTARGNIQ